MAYAEYLSGLLRPLGVYTLAEGSFSGAAVRALGKTMDEADALCAENLREGIVMTAEDAGLDTVEDLFRYKPVASSAVDRRAAIAGLMMVSGDSFTLAALRKCLRGCGVEAQVEETEQAGVVRVSFPGIMGVPEGFDRMRVILEDILPCHLVIVYAFRFVTWQEFEDNNVCWDDIEGMAWQDVEVMEFSD